jgi:hypothetical protein
VDTLTGLVVPRASVVIARIEQTTDSAGRFFFPRVLLGQQTVSVRRVGYRESEITITFRAGDSLFRRVALEPLPVRFTDVKIGESVHHVPAPFVAPYQRAARGVGHFFIADDIGRLNPSNVAALLNRVQGVTVNDRGVTFQRCQAGIPSPGIPGGGSPNGKVQLWIDGYRVTGRTSQSLVELLANVPPSAIEIIEVYPSISQIPADFLEDACAVIAIWTRRS